MGAIDAIRSRRTHKLFGTQPVPRPVLEELLEAATCAPNHRLTQPWRFRVLGPETFARLADAAGPGDAAKLRRAPTLIVVTCVLADDELQREEDLAAVAAATYGLLLAAHERGLATFWRTPGVLRTAAGRAAVELADDEHVVALVHLGPAVDGSQRKERGSLETVVRFLP